MCFSSPKPPATQPAPVIPPPPTILPTSISEVSAQDTARKQQISQLRYGFASTIKNQGGAAGILNTNNQGTAKTTLG